MTTLAEAAGEIAATLRTGTGLVVVTDPREANPPCVWLQPAEIEHLGLNRATLVVAWHLWLIANDVDAITALDQIDGMRSTIVGLGAHLAAPDNPALWLPLSLTEGAKPLPALRYTIRTKVT